MRILLCHNRYQQEGGEDAAVAAELSLLQEHGHEVKFHEVDNDAITGVVAKLRVGITAAYSRTAREEMAVQLKAFRPDIVHVHNFFPLLTPSIYDACIEARVPVVQTLHNYRILCPGALLMRRWCDLREVCNRFALPGGVAPLLPQLDAAIPRCGADGRFPSPADSWNRKVTRFIALTEFARQKFIEGGILPEKMVVKPNSLAHLPPVGEMPPRGDFALFIGRISVEKGVETLVDAFCQTGLPLKIAGSGPLESRLKQRSTPNIQWLGRIPPQEVMAQARQARYLVLPSLCYEGFPMAIPEAFANHLPVLASRIGSLAGIVTDGATGHHFTPGSVAELAERSRYLHQNVAECERMGERAFGEYLLHYTPEQNYRRLLMIYGEAIDLYA
jgi:glycosyltransferase involved in cell wall biosynthesis